MYSVVEWEDSMGWGELVVVWVVMGIFFVFACRAAQPTLIASRLKIWESEGGVDFTRARHSSCTRVGRHSILSVFAEFYNRSANGLIFYEDPIILDNKENALRSNYNRNRSFVQDSTRSILTGEEIMISYGFGRTQAVNHGNRGYHCNRSSWHWDVHDHWNRYVLAYLCFTKWMRFETIEKQN